MSAPEQFPMLYVDIDECRPNEWNPNEQTKEEFERLRQEIREVGFIAPIQVVETDEDPPYVIIGGEHRWKAARSEGYTQVPVIVLNKKRFTDGDLQRFLTMRLNNLHGRTNPEKFIRMYKELEGKYEVEDLRKLMAFTEKDAAWKALQKSVKKTMQEALRGSPSAVRDMVDDTIKGAKPGSDLGKILKHIMNNHGGSLMYGFLVFSFGGQEHTYIAITGDMKESLDDLLEMAKERNCNINQLLAPALRRCADDLREQEELDREKADLDASVGVPTE